MTLYRRTALALTLAALLGGCSMGGGKTGLSPGLSARMDQPGAMLDRAAALSIVNQYRAVSGAPALRGDADLDAMAQSLANAYASSGSAPTRPGGIVGMRVSAGYPTFADTFSGWRNSPADAQVLAERGARRAGIAVAFSGSSTYGTHWVLVLDD